VVKGVASPAHDPTVIEDRLTPVLPLNALPSEPLLHLGRVSEIACQVRETRGTAP
jgi:hypothetical protein